MFSDILTLYFLANHESRNMLQENSMNLPPGAEMYTVGPFLRRFREEHTIVRNNTNRATEEVTIANDESWTESFFEIMEFGSVNNTS